MDPYPVQNPNSIDTNTTRSISLIGLGFTQLIASVLLFCYCTWILSVDSKIYVNYIAIFFCFFHLAISFLAIVGGLDIVKARCVIVFCFVLGLTATFIIVLTIFPTFLVWARTTEICGKCSTIDIINNKKLEPNSFMDSCRPVCNHIHEIFLPLSLCVFFQGIVNCVVSSIACCIICRCGYYNIDNINPGRIIYPQYTPLLYQFDHVYTIPARCNRDGDLVSPSSQETRFQDD